MGVLVSGSVYADGKSEALRHKWIVSEKAGHDLGPSAIHSWCREHWHDFLRHCWLQHIHGIQFWEELDRGDFGLLNRELLDEPILVDRILDRLADGQENLDVIQWAYDWRLPIDRVLRVLEVLDINSRRLDSIIEREGYFG